MCVYNHSHNHFSASFIRFKKGWWVFQMHWYAFNRENTSGDRFYSLMPGNPITISLATVVPNARRLCFERRQLTLAGITEFVISAGMDDWMMKYASLIA